MDIKSFRQYPILGIVRGIEANKIPALAETVIKAGLKHIEITMNTEDAAPMIRDLIRESDGKLSVGAGTVLTGGDLQAALDAGAEFIVSPVIVPEVITFCVERSIPVFPGAFAPQHIYEAWRLGATMVKLFPAKTVGSSYIREIKGPFSDIPILACGGVNPDNIRDFFNAGAEAVAFGSSIFKHEWMETGDFGKVGKALTKLINAYNACDSETN